MQHFSLGPPVLSAASLALHVFLISKMKVVSPSWSISVGVAVSPGREGAARGRGSGRHGFALGTRHRYNKPRQTSGAQSLMTAAEDKDWGAAVKGDPEPGRVGQDFHVVLVSRKATVSSASRVPGWKGVSDYLKRRDSFRT